MFNTSKYWEERLSSNFNLVGVGDITLTLFYNKLLYKIRARAFKRTLRKCGKLSKSLKILDMGSGTGFYISRWLKNGFNNLEGSDITTTAVENLKDEFPEINFLKLDVTVEPEKKMHGRYDVISIMDVLFHITDDSLYEKAFRNFDILLKNDGFLILSENVLKEDHLQDKRMHFSVRTEQNIKHALEENHFKTIARIPMFILLNAPIASKNKLFRKLVYTHLRFCRESKLYCNISGAVLFPFEYILISFLTCTPSTSILVLRKK